RRDDNPNYVRIHGAGEPLRGILTWRGASGLEKIFYLNTGRPEVVNVPCHHDGTLYRADTSELDVSRSHFGTFRVLTGFIHY
ncbi:hypothetical protein, partial [Cereibacter sphaeroides]